jgi:hypothetical protein
MILSEMSSPWRCSRGTTSHRPIDLAASDSPIAAIKEFVNESKPNHFFQI